MPQCDKERFALANAVRGTMGYSAPMAPENDDAADFVARTIGDLATAAPELRDTLRAYIREEFNTTRTARALFTHRNTILNRLARAEKLLRVKNMYDGDVTALALYQASQPRPVTGFLS